MTQLSERRITNGDFKRIYLPIGDWEIEPPDTGIYDEPVFYYKANYKWASMIEGFVSWLTEITAWKNAEDENYSGIQAIMTFLERIVIEIDCAQVEDCLETSTIINNMITNITNNTTNITTNTTNITNVTNQVEIMEEEQHSRNQVPLANTYAGDDLCNAAAYTSQQIIENAISVFNQKNSSNFVDWIENTLNNGAGWIGNAIEGVWDAIDGSYTNTIVELVASNPYVEDALFDNNLDRIAAKTAVLADTSISAAAKAAVAAMLDALTDGQIANWAMVGKATTAGGCGSVTAWNWIYATHACSYGLPAGWSLTITEGACGDGIGAFDGIYKTATSAIARVSVTLAFPTQYIANIRISGFTNGFHASNFGDLQVVSGTINDTQALAQNPSVTNANVIIGQLVSSIVVTARHYSSTQNPRGVVLNRLGVNVS